MTLSGSLSYSVTLWHLILLITLPFMHYILWIPWLGLILVTLCLSNFFASSISYPSIQMPPQYSALPFMLIHLLWWCQPFPGLWLSPQCRWPQTYISSPTHLSGCKSTILAFCWTSLFAKTQNLLLNIFSQTNLPPGFPASDIGISIPPSHLLDFKVQIIFMPPVPK